MQDRIHSLTSWLHDARERVRAFLTKHGRKLTIAVAVVAVVAVASGPLTLAAPGSCNACHARSGEYLEWRESAHATAGCETCHTQRGYLLGLGNSAALGSEVWRTVFGGRGDAPVPSAPP